MLGFIVQNSPKQDFCFLWGLALKLQQTPPLHFQTLMVSYLQTNQHSCLSI